MYGVVRELWGTARGRCVGLEEFRPRAGLFCRRLRVSRDVAGLRVRSGDEVLVEVPSGRREIEVRGASVPRERIVAVRCESGVLWSREIPRHLSLVWFRSIVLDADGERLVVAVVRAWPWQRGHRVAARLAIALEVRCVRVWVGSYKTPLEVLYEICGAPGWLSDT